MRSIRLDRRFRYRSGASSFWLALTGLAVLLVSCLEFGGGPTISEFRADPSNVASGEEVVLSWQVDNLSGGRLVLHAVEEGAAEPTELGEVTGQTQTAVIAHETTTYRLIATAPGGTTSREAKVSVVGGSSEDGPTIGYFRASKMAGLEPGESVELEWSVQGADKVTLTPPGQPVAAQGRKTVTPNSSTTYQLSASNEDGSSSATVTVQVGDCNCLLFLVAGQSNASGYGKENDGNFPTAATEAPQDGVWMMTADRTWLRAAEPIHSGAKHSFGLRFGKEVRAATGLDVYLVPAAVGGSALSDWQPGDQYFDDAVGRTAHAAETLGVPTAAVLWLQGETESKYTWTRKDFVSRTDNVFQGFRNQLPGTPDMLYVQLSKRLFHGTEEGNNVEGHNLAYQQIRELQRLMEAGAKEVSVGGSAESSIDRPYYHMVVAHDLPMSDVKHVSAEGQRYLGQRLAHAFVNRIWQTGSQGTGPRLAGISMPDPQTVIVDTTMEISASSNFDGYFTVFQDGQAVPYSAIGRDSDSSRIRIEFTAPLSGEIEVRYMPPDDTALYTGTGNAVHSLVAGLKLPLPAFNGPVEPIADSYPGLRGE